MLILELLSDANRKGNEGRELTGSIWLKKKQMRHRVHKQSLWSWDKKGLVVSYDPPIKMHTIDSKRECEAQCFSCDDDSFDEIQWQLS